MTLGMAWLLCLLGTPISIGVMCLLSYIQDRGTQNEDLGKLREGHKRRLPRRNY